MSRKPDWIGGAIVVMAIAAAIAVAITARREPSRSSATPTAPVQ